MSFGKKSSKKKYLIFLLIIVAVGVVSYLLGSTGVFKGKKQISSHEIESTIKDSAQLTTAYMEYKGLMKVSEGEIPFITKKGFTMVYTAKIDAGTDLEQAKVKLTDKKVVVTVPKANILSVNVDPKSVEFYDEKQALFNWTQKKDITKACEDASKNAEEKADTESLLKESDRRTKEIIKEITGKMVPGKEVEIDIK